MSWRSFSRKHKRQPFTYRGSALFHRDRDNVRDAKSQAKEATMQGQQDENEDTNREPATPGGQLSMREFARKFGFEHLLEPGEETLHDTLGRMSRNLDAAGIDQLGDALRDWYPPPTGPERDSASEEGDG